MRAEHDELVSAQARQQLVLAEAARDPGADLAQQLVARLVTQGVVDLLEAVQVEHEHRDVLAAGQAGVQADEEATPVQQAGELVGAGLATCLAERADLAEGQRGADAGGEDRRRGQVAPDLGVGVGQHGDAGHGEDAGERDGAPPRRPGTVLGVQGLRDGDRAAGWNGGRTSGRDGAGGPGGGQSDQHARERPQDVERGALDVGAGRRPQREDGVGDADDGQGDGHQPQLAPSAPAHRRQGGRRDDEHQQVAGGIAQVHDDLGRTPSAERDAAGRSPGPRRPRPSRARPPHRRTRCSPGTAARRCATSSSRPTYIAGKNAR